MKSIEAEVSQTGGGPVWDLPTRLFHWLLVALIAFSWWSAEEEHLDWHIWSGIAVVALLVFRLLWGLVGSSTARFVNFVRGPRAVLAYLRDMKGWRPVGHTPLGALSVLAMLAALAVQAGLGLFSVDEEGLNEGPLAHWISFDAAEEATDLHEDWFDVILVLVVFHIAAILFYRLFLGKKLTGGMISGKATLDPEAEPMRPSKWWVALLCLLAALSISLWISAGARLSAA